MTHLGASVLLSVRTLTLTLPVGLLEENEREMPGGCVVPGADVSGSVL